MEKSLIGHLLTRIGIFSGKVFLGRMYVGYRHVVIVYADLCRCQHMEMRLRELMMETGWEAIQSGQMDGMRR